MAVRDFDYGTSLLPEGLATVLDAVGPCVVLDHGGRILYPNSAFRALYGWQPSEIFGRSLRELVGEVPADGSAYHRTRDGIPVAVHVRRSALAENRELVAIQDETALNASRAEVELRRGQVERLMGRMSDGLVAINPDGTIQALNASGERLLGLPIDFVRGKPWRETLLAALGSDAVGVVDRVLDTGQAESMVTTLPQTGFLVDAKAHPMPDGVSLYLALAGATTAEAVCRDIFEASPEAQLLLEDNIIVECNLSAVRLLGLGMKSQLLGRTAPSFSPSVLHDGTLAELRRQEIAAGLLRRGSYYGEWTFVRSDGRHVPVHLALSNVRIGGKLMEHAIWHDLTDQKAAETAVREVEDRFRAIVENSSDVVYLLSATGKLRFVNPSFTRVFGFEEEEVLGQPLTRFVHPEDLHRLREQRDRAMRDERAEHFDFRMITREGEYRHLSTSGAVLRSGDGTINFVGTAHDVTDRVRITAELAAARDAAVASSRAKSEFLATVSHEVRTPLNGVIGSADLLLDAPLGAEERELSRTIQSSGETLLRIIDDILEISKAQAGHLALVKEPADLRALLGEVCELLRPRAEEKGIGLDFQWSDSLGSWAHVDAARLKQIVGNLVGNALKFTREGSVTVAGSLSADGLCRVSVQDTGIGISAEARDEVFLPFKQADGRIQREFGGTGLGLSICKELVEAMGGTIGLVSEPGEGSCFAFEIPVCAATPVAAVERAAPMVTAGLRVLVVEDNEVNRLVVTRMLANLGCEIYAAGSGEEALVEADARHHDLILMDVQMPGLDGLETTRRIRAHGTQPDVRIVALTANAFQEDREACLAAGMNAFLSKPIRRADLARILA
ncbi:MAG: PAS domain S-box protein [Fimbriimonas sp.]